MDVKLNTSSRNHIDVDVVNMHTGKGFCLIGFYGNVETYKWKESWVLLKHLSHLSSSLWLCMGDFNEILDNSERKGQGYRPEWQIRDFGEVVVQCGLHDLGYVGNSFTWRNKKDANAFVTARLDLQNSDHCPFILDILDGLWVQRKKKIFQFEAMWVKDEQCKGVVEQALGDLVAEGSLMFQVVEKLKGCRASLIGWSKERFSSLASTIKGKRAQLQQLVNETLSRHLTGIMFYRMSLMAYWRRKRIFWRQRSRVAWMSEEKTKLAEIVVDYYQAIFTSSNPSVESINTCLQGMESVVTNDMNAHLQAKFTSYEVYQALKQMYLTKAPRPDGMSAIFYQTCWDIVGPESMSLKRKGRKGHMALKLDMSKAYDRVEWDFLESIMRRMGFAGEWIRLMMMCLRSVSYSVLINGEQCRYFTASRGIRQGDSLSPYLFLLCAEGLSFLLRKAMAEKKINGVAASRDGPKLTHLFFCR
uniref:Reverse transcriptase domain-containing protein n=1 Tax=Fagus sylvatica TaxID=28930 RepID=A0A2N9FA00_FAGSY